MTAAGRFVNGAFHKIFVIDLPAKGGITARGNWQLRIKGKAATTYETAAIVDGGPITYDARFDLKRPRAGDPLSLVVRVTANGKLLSRPPNVTVTLMSPGAAVGDIIATIKPTELKAFEPGTTRARRRCSPLHKTPECWQR